MQYTWCHASSNSPSNPNRQLCNADPHNQSARRMYLMHPMYRMPKRCQRFADTLSCIPVPPTIRRLSLCDITCAMAWRDLTLICSNSSSVPNASLHAASAPLHCKMAQTRCSCPLPAILHCAGHSPSLQSPVQTRACKFQQSESALPGGA